MTIKNDAKFQKELSGQFKIDMMNNKGLPKHSKTSQICTLMGWFWPKYIMFELRKHRGVMYDGTQDWYKIWGKTDLCFQKWHDEFSKVSPERLEVLKLGLWWHPFV